MMMYLTPAVCLIAGVGSLWYTIKVWKERGTLSLKTLILAIVGIPAFIAFMLQIFGIISHPELASKLWTEYFEKWQQEQAQQK